MSARYDLGTLATALGLHARHHVSPRLFEGSFAQLLRRIGPAIVGGAGSLGEDGLVGTWSGVEVAVAFPCSLAGDRSLVCCPAVAARIEPPILLGLDVHPTMTSLGTRTVSAKAWSARGSELLTKIGAVDLIEWSARFDGHVSIRDTIVVLQPRSFRIEMVAIEHALDTATHVARDLAARRTALRLDSSEEGRRGAWQRFATQHDLRFDPATMRLGGTWQGVEIAVALESHPAGIEHVIAVRLQRALSRPALEATLTTLRERFPEVHADDASLTIVAAGSLATEEELSRALEDACEAAQVLCGGPATAPSGPYR